MLLATALALLITGCAQQTFAVQNKPVASRISPSFLRFWNWAEAVDAAKICGSCQKMLLKQVQQTFVNGLLWFYYFKHLYSAGSYIVYCSQ